MKKTFLFIMTFFCAIFITMPVLSQPKDAIPPDKNASFMKKPWHHSPGLENPENEGAFGAERIFVLLEDLNLSNEQLGKLTNLRKKSKREIAQLRHEIKLSIWDIQDEFANKNPDKSKIDSAIEKISNNQKQLLKIRISQMFEIKNILTDEQYKKLISLLETSPFMLKKSMKKCIKK